MSHILQVSHVTHTTSESCHTYECPEAHVPLDLPWRVRVLRASFARTRALSLPPSLSLSLTRTHSICTPGRTSRQALHAHACSLSLSLLPSLSLSLSLLHTHTKRTPGTMSDRASRARSQTDIRQTYHRHTTDIRQTYDRHTTDIRLSRRQTYENTHTHKHTRIFICAHIAISPAGFLALMRDTSP